MSSHPDRVRGVGIYRAPAHLSKAQFEQKMEALVDSVLAVPIVKKNALNVEILVQNTTLDTHFQTLGLPRPPQTIIVTTDWESEAHLQEASNDPTVKQLLAGGITELGLHADSFSFAAHVVTKFDRKN